MSKKAYAELEQHVIRTMQRDRLFQYHHRFYELLNVGKPRPQGRGECKTDVYIELLEKSTGQRYEIKISVKIEGRQEFQENKVSAKRAEAFFGVGWQNVIMNATKSLSSKFENSKLLYVSGDYPTKPNSITLGWKLELANKRRPLSIKAPLSDREIRDYVYKGVNQPSQKKDAVVNGIVIPNSGVADNLLVTTKDRIRSATDVLSQMVPIDFADISDIYLIFTANNYRINDDSADHSRPLAVRIEWRVYNGKLEPFFYYDSPLMYRGESDMLPLLKNALKMMGKRNVKDIDPYHDLSNPNIYQY